MSEKLQYWINNENLNEEINVFKQGESFDVINFVKEKMKDINLVESVMPDNISGFIKKKGDVFYICVNKNHHPNRKRFTVAHELGHYFRHKEKVEATEDGLVDFNGGGLNLKRNGFGVIEDEANEFAAELLMPEYSFKKLWNETDGDLSRLSNIFIVSESAIYTRASKLDLPMNRVSSFFL